MDHNIHKQVDITVYCQKHRIKEEEYLQHYFSGNYFGRKKNFAKFLEYDIQENRGRIVCLTAQHLCGKTPDNPFKNCTILNSLSKAVTRITGDKANEMEPVKLFRVDRKTNEIQLVPNMNVKEFSTFVEIEKLLNRTEGKTANNLTEQETQNLIQFLGNLF